MQWGYHKLWSQEHLRDRLVTFTLSIVGSYFLPHLSYKRNERCRAHFSILRGGVTPLILFEVDSLVPGRTFEFIIDRELTEVKK